jgi:hypothetical protein
MNERDAQCATNLYHQIGGLDRTIAHVEARSDTHKIEVHVWACVSTGNYPLKIELRDDLAACRDLQQILKDSLLRRRQALVQDLVLLGFDPPAEQSQ